MIKQNQSYFNWFNRIIDLGIMVAAYLLAVWFWIVLLGNETTNPAMHYAFENPLPMLVMAGVFVLVFQYAGMYDSFRFKRIYSELLQLTKAFAVCIALLIAFLYLVKLRDFSRGVMIVFVLLGYTLLAVKRAIVHRVLRVMREKGYNQKQVLLVGNGHLAREYIRSVQEKPQHGFQIIGFVGTGFNGQTGRFLGGFDKLDEVLNQYGPDEIVLALEQDELSHMAEVIQICEEQGIRTSIIPVYNDYLPACTSIDVQGDVRLINLRAIPLDLTLNRVLKRAMDIVLSLLAIVLSSPVMLVIAAVIRCSGGGPVLFKQTRVGRDRKEFVMYKFRSMVPNKESDTAWSTTTDNRVTPFGAFIRKFSLDELPQFFNVLKGEMSIVGPRPELPHFVQQYKRSVPKYMVKHQVLPGLTGWAQIHGYRGDTSIEERIKYDIWYIENWSVFLDIKIMLSTVFGGMINGEKNMGKTEKKG